MGLGYFDAKWEASTSDISWSFTESSYMTYISGFSPFRQIDLGFGFSGPKLEKSNLVQGRDVCNCCDTNNIIDEINNVLYY